MKLKLYSISLLLSFLTLLSHEMIPHHHVDMAFDNISGFHKPTAKHHHSESHQHHHDTKKRHDRSDGDKDDSKTKFPLHFHSTATKHLSSVRQTVKNYSSTVNTIKAIRYSIYSIFRSKELPITDLFRDTEIPFRIKPKYEPGATGLRAPPCIA